MNQLLKPIISLISDNHSSHDLSHHSLSEKALMLIALLALSLSVNGAENEVDLSSLQNWKSHEFVGESQFSWDAKQECLLMSADKTASAKILENDFPIDSTVSWSWKQIKPIKGVDQRVKKGDDFSARVYIAVEHPYFFWKSRVLTYVLAQTEPVDAHWSNPFTDQFQMWVVTNAEGKDETDWYSVTRNIKKDWKKAFGDEPKTFHAVGLMVDSDNSEQLTQSCIKDLKIVENK